MTRKFFMACFTIFIGAFLIQPLFADDPLPANTAKHTPQGKYISARETYEKWAADTKKSLVIIDVRIPEEYVFVGHPEMAINIPFKVWTGKYDPEKKMVALDQNPNFVSEIKKIAKPSDTIYLSCRSGDRSALAAKALDKEGYKNVYSVVDGFEGDLVSDPESYFDGKRMRNGWKNSGAPWTYGLDPKLMPTIPLK